MLSKAQEIASRCLRAMLSRLSVGASCEDSEDFRDFQSALERLLPAWLAETEPSWRYESLDAFRFVVARKTGPAEAEFVGLCLLISDQAWTPLYLRLRLSPHDAEFDGIDLRLGELGSGRGGMIRTPYGSGQESTLLAALEQRLGSLSWVHTFERGYS